MASNKALIEYLNDLRKEKYLSSHVDNSLLLEIIDKLKEYNNIVVDIESLLIEVKEDILDDMNIFLSGCDDVSDALEYIDTYSDLDLKAYIRYYLIDKGVYND